MPIAIKIDQPVNERGHRADMYGGTVHITTATTASVAFIEFARGLIGEAFGGRDPELAQFDLPIDDYATIVRALQDAFLAHPETRRRLQELLVDRGCDPESTYFDAPRLRVCTSDDYLGAGFAYAWHPYRDTWRSAPLAQLNHWIPVYEISEDNAKALHPEYFNRAVANDSAHFNHYRHNAERRAAAASGGRAQVSPLPGLAEPVDLLASTVLVPPCAGLLEFSGQHLHSSVPNTSGRTRFSIEFGIVDVDDIRAGLNARNVDGRATGSSIRDFVSAADLSPIPGDVVALFHDGTEASGDLVYDPPTDTRAPATN